MRMHTYAIQICIFFYHIKLPFSLPASIFLHIQQFGIYLSLLQFISILNLHFQLHIPFDSMAFRLLLDDPFACCPFFSGELLALGALVFFLLYSQYLFEKVHHDHRLHTHLKRTHKYQKYKNKIDHLSVNQKGKLQNELDGKILENVFGGEIEIMNKIEGIGTEIEQKEEVLRLIVQIALKCLGKNGELYIKYINSMHNYQNIQENMQIFFCMPPNALQNNELFPENHQFYHINHPSCYYSDAINPYLPFTALQNSSYTFQNLPPIQEIPLPTVSSMTNLRQENDQRNQKNSGEKKSKNLEKEIESAKKNAQSNLVNHFFSFFSHKEKSEHIVEAVINSMDGSLDQKEKLFHLFYNTIHALNSKRGRKYVNKRLLQSLILPQQLTQEMPQIKEKVEKAKNVRVQDLCSMLRKCIFYFYRGTNLDLILTSRRISMIARSQHLRKKRKLNLKLFTDFS